MTNNKFFRNFAKFCIFILLFGITIQPALAATYTVSNTNDTGAGSLRQAIIDANNNGGADTIDFSATGTLTPGSALPAITDNETTIDGSTLSGIFNISGANSGLVIEASTSIINGGSNKYLRLGNGSSYGIRIGDGATPISMVDVNNLYIGTLDGTSDNGFGDSGVYVAGLVSAGYIRNSVISGNGDSAGEHGMEFAGGNSYFFIQGNYIGTNAAGSAAIANADNGINMDDCDVCQIGGNNASLRNIVSGNTNEGIEVTGGGTQSTDATYIYGNYIGLNAAGTAAVANGAEGIKAGGPHILTIGSANDSERNIISGNDGPGIEFSNGKANDTFTIRNNYIGTNASGNSAVANANGVLIDQCQVNDTVYGNVISGNTGYGVRVTPTSADLESDCTIQSNYIGTNASAADLGNGTNGVELYDFVDGTKVLENTISYSTGRGAYLHNNGGSNPDNVTLSQNIFTNNDVAGIVSDAAGSGHDITRNSVNTNNYGIFWQDGDSTLLANNMVYDNEAAGFLLMDGDSVDLYNNTFRNNATAATSQDSQYEVGYVGGSNADFINNIVYNTSAGYTGIVVTGGTGTFTADTNDYYVPNGALGVWGSPPPVATLAAWQSASSQDAFSTDVDPVFTALSGNGYPISDTSPVADLGTTLGSVTVDFYGTSRPQGSGYSMGADEETGSGGGGVPEFSIFTLMLALVAGIGVVGLIRKMQSKGNFA